MSWRKYLMMKVVIPASLLLCSFLSIVVANEANPATGIEQSEVFVSGQGGYDTYRIPSIVVTDNGALLAFCEGRKNGAGDAGDIDLVMRRSTDGGKNWSPITVIWNDKDNTCGNPCAVVDEQTGTVWLLMTWNLGSDHEGAILNNTSQDSRRVFVTCSNDDGLSWSKPEEITQSVKAPHWRWYATGPGHGIQLKSGAYKGRLVIPADHSFAEYGPGYQYGAHIVYSDDHGKSWRYSDVVLPGFNENEVVELLDGRLMMNARNHRYRGSRGIAYSFDGGQTWPHVFYQSSLQEPRCQASTIRYWADASSDKDRVLFSNPNHAEKRLNMTVKLSCDGGQTWPIGQCIHPGPSAYSCLEVLLNGKIACLYEGGQKHPYEKIVLAVFSLDWLTEDSIKADL